MYALIYARYSLALISGRNSRWLLEKVDFPRIGLPAKLLKVGDAIVVGVAIGRR